MAYSLPVFNVKMNVWFTGNAPSMGPPDIVGAFVQLYVLSRPSIDITPSAPFEWVPPVNIRVPLSIFQAGGPPWVGAYFRYVDSVGNQWFYLVRWWEHYHAEFPNAYVSFLCEQCDQAGLTPDPNR